MNTTIHYRPQKFYQKTSETIKKFISEAGYTINLLCYTPKTVMDTLPFTVVSKKIKYLDRNKPNQESRNNENF